MSPLIFMEMGKVFHLIVYFLHSVSLCEKDTIIVVVIKGSISLELLVYYLFAGNVSEYFEKKFYVVNTTNDFTVP